jgi:hypothetical protein
MTRSQQLTSDAIERMILTTEPWLSCDDCFDRLDDVIEAVLTQTRAMDEAFRVHLTGCTVCREEALSLATLIASDQGLDPEHAASVLEAAVRRGRSPRP